MQASVSRTIERVIASQPASAGTFTVRRALPASGRHSVGPWVFLDHFGPFRVAGGDEGVGPHPHAGIETVTYLLTGRNEHRDSAGHHGIVTAGGAQWMTAAAASFTRNGRSPTGPTRWSSTASSCGSRCRAR